jgi:hypothetical protein
LPAKPLSNAYSAMIEVNFEDFFVEGKKQPDLRSIMLHELGHLLGADHSCDNNGKAGFVNCNTLGEDDLSVSIFEAVLYPVVPFFEDGTGEQRRELNENDQGRSNCIYDTSGSTSSTSTSNGS